MMAQMTSDARIAALLALVLFVAAMSSLPGVV
jgi:hypothetical protein